MTNRFKGLDLVDGVPEELQMEVYNTVTKPSKEKEIQEGKVIFEEVSQIAEKRREAKEKREMEIYIQLNAQSFREQQEEIRKLS